jgi:hypothetical protein
MKLAVSNPFDLWRTSLQLGLLAYETQAVVAMRLWGMAGLWNVAATENSQMVSEKPGAWIEAASDALTAAWGGATPDRIMLSAIKPLRVKTRSNSRRLARGGPRLR